MGQWGQEREGLSGRPGSRAALGPAFPQRGHGRAREADGDSGWKWLRAYC